MPNEVIKLKCVVLKKIHKYVIPIACLLLAAVSVRGQVGYLLPSMEEQFGHGIRKVVQRESDGSKQVYKVARNGTMSSSMWQTPAVRRVRTRYDEATGDSITCMQVKRYDHNAQRKRWIDIEIRKQYDMVAGVGCTTVWHRFEEGKLMMAEMTRRDFQTLTDSVFQTPLSEYGINPEGMTLESVRRYSNHNFDTIVYYRLCREGVLQHEATLYKVDDTLITIDSYESYFKIHKQYQEGEEHRVYASDSTLNELYRLTRNERGMPDTIYEWRKNGAPHGCVRPKEWKDEEWERTETHRYKYNSRGGIVEDNIYIDGTLVRQVRYKLRYRLFK